MSLLISISVDEGSVPVHTHPSTSLTLWLLIFVISPDFLFIKVSPKFPMKSILSPDGIDKKLASPVISLEFAIPFILMGISLFESTMEPTIIPLLAA